MKTRALLLYLTFLCVTGGACARPDTVPLGVVFRGEEIRFSLAFSNTGNEPVAVAGAETSCECLAPKFARRGVEPGETVSLAFSYHSAVTGPVSIAVDFVGPDRKPAGRRMEVTAFVTEKDWLVPPAALHRRVSAPPITLVDVRSSQRFAEAHLPHAINLPVFAIKTHADLRARRVVLIDDGVAPDELLEHARNLRLRGFHEVVVLAGGMPAWMRAGFPVEGSADSVVPIATISPATLVRARASAEWRVIEIGAGAADPRDELVQEVGDVVSRLQAHRPDATRLSANVLVIARDAATHARVEARLNVGNAPPVFYLAGGRAALGAFLIQQTLTAQGTRLERPPHVHVTGRAATGGCNTCPK